MLISKEMLLGTAAMLLTLPAWAVDSTEDSRVSQATLPKAAVTEATATESGAVRLVARQVRIIQGSTSAAPEWSSEVTSDRPTAQSQLAQRLRMASHREANRLQSLNVQESVSDADIPSGPVEGLGMTKPEGMASGDGLNGSCTTGNCGEGDCDGDCSDCGDDECSCCCNEFWRHRGGFYAELLYLHASGVDMAHAIQQNGVGGPGTTPAGRVGVVDQEHEPGIRFGFAKALDSCSSVSLNFASVESHDTDQLAAPAGVGGTVASLVLHPNSTNAGSTSSLVNASYDIDFQTVDLEFSRLLSGSANHAVNYNLGLRFGNLEQQFSQTGSFAPPAGVINTVTDIDFDGAGLRLGIDGRRRLGCGGFSFYGKSFINVLFGEFDSSFTQTNLTTTVVQATSNWSDERVVPVLEYELGVSWASASGRLRLSTGYYTAFWFNAITTPEYVQAVQNANFVNLGDTIAFDGATARLEYRF